MHHSKTRIIYTIIAKKDLLEIKSPLGTILESLARKKVPLKPRIAIKNTAID